MRPKWNPARRSSTYTPECYTEYLRRGKRIAHGEPIPDEYEIDIIRKDGAVRHLQLFRRQVLWNGKTEFQILYNDITERVQAEIGLKASEQNFRNSMDNSSASAFVLWAIADANSLCQSGVAGYVRVCKYCRTEQQPAASSLHARITGCVLRNVR